MTRILKKKGNSGTATTFLSRKQALKKLQLTLKDFRRLCILKGIYPVEPRNKKRANKNSSTDKTYYFVKDILFLAHEPLIAKFRSIKIFIRRLQRAIGRKDQDASQHLRSNQPTFKLDHLVKERYPTFIDALRDLDDAISMCYLFSTFPKMRNIRPELIHLCRRLTVEFLHYVIQSRSLRKVFVSIKGYYYQAEIMGQLITWVVPHNLGYCNPTDVDFKIMVTFTEFYSTMLGFVNFKLFNTLNIIYPPKLSVASFDNVEDEEEDSVEHIAALNLNLKTALSNSMEEDVQIDEFNESEDSDDLKEAKKAAEKIDRLKKLFEGCKVFVNREVPRESIVFIIRCFGGDVSFDKMFLGSTFEESDETITHQIIDRPMLANQYLNRFYAQPQWIYDSVNAGMLLPIEMYFPGVKLPPHLSPFVEEKEGDYIPPEKQALLDMQNGIIKGSRKGESEDELSNDGTDDSDKDSEDEKVDEVSRKTNLQTKKNDKTAKMKVTSGVLERVDSTKLSQKQAAENKRLAMMMMRKKDKHLYNKIIFGQKRKNREALKLKEKREEYDRAQKRRKV